jgi:hypothetical protein
MKLSSTEVIVEYRVRLKLLRAARAAVTDAAGGKLSCHTWHHGEEYDFSALLSKTNLKAQLRAMLDHEINEIVRAIEAHGVVCDE